MTTYTNGVINLSIEPQLAELEQLNVPMLGRLNRYSTSQTQVKYNVNVGGATAVSELVSADADGNSGDVIKPAKLPIADYRLRSKFSIHEVQIAEAKSQGIPALSNLISLSAESAKREILQGLGAGIFVGNGTSHSDVLGLSRLHTAITASKATNAYAGLDPAVDPLWTTYVKGTFGAITKAKLQAFSADYRQGKTTGVAGTFTALVMSPTTALLYSSAFDSSVVVNADYTNVADLGVRGMSFEGRPIVEDPNCPDGTIYFVNENDLRLYSFRQTNAGGSVDSSEQGILMYVKEMGSANPQEVSFVLYGMYQLALMERRSVAVITGVTA
ncbi:MAG: phage major capsid protein [Myxacorys californica WJT36-NPBG1]|jgi:hypothetical protein|nr:phage major capsid protein [Myxacorys californica WJT36-NPBG1]